MKMKHEKLRFLILFVVYAIPLITGLTAHFMYSEPLTTFPNKYGVTEGFSGMVWFATVFNLAIWVPLITWSGMAEAIIGFGGNEEA